MPSAEHRLPPAHEPVTVDEFIAWDDGRGGKYQLVDGEVRAMSPASTTHCTIQSNLARLLTTHLDVPGNRCRSLTEPAVETRVRAKLNMRVPDLGVTCAPDAATQIALPDPILLIEIMSPGNKKDTWDNVWAYTTLPSVVEILIVQSMRIEALLLRRQADGSWPPDPELIGSNASLTLASIDFSAPLTAAYAKTHLVP
jgi:Uma2 family endonuclease